MNELWEVLFECGLAREKGLANIIDRQNIQEFITNNALANVIQCGVKDKQSDYVAKIQWKSNKKPPRPLRDKLKTF